MQGGSAGGGRGGLGGGGRGDGSVGGDGGGCGRCSGGGGAGGGGAGGGGGGGFGGRISMLLMESPPLQRIFSLIFSGEQHTTLITTVFCFSSYTWSRISLVHKIQHHHTYI